LIPECTPRELVEAAVDEISVRLSAPRAAHQREGHERFTLDAILDEEAAVLDLVDAREDRAQLWVKDEDTASLSRDQKRAVENIGRSPWLVQPRCAPCAPPRTAGSTAPYWCWRPPVRPSTSRSAKAPGTRV
jgi:hypothetical protein